MTRLGTPRPNNGGAREGTGPLRKRLPIWKPFSAKKSATISKASIQLLRCNFCGAMGWSDYTEVARYKDYARKEEIEHAAQPLQHKPGCPVGG